MASHVSFLKCLSSLLFSSGCDQIFIKLNRSSVWSPFSLSRFHCRSADSLQKGFALPASLKLIEERDRVANVGVARAVEIVVLPLNTLIVDRINKLLSRGIAVGLLREVKVDEEGDTRLCCLWDGVSQE